MKKNIAIVTGGNVAERDISLKSAKTIKKHLDKEQFRTFLIELNDKTFTATESSSIVNLNDFSLNANGEKITFDLVYLMIHGHPAEDGRIQGYFDILGIPYTGCDSLVSALTFDKQACKTYLRSFDISMAASKVLFKGQPWDTDDLLKMGLPLFVKPNQNGSSYGVSKVSNAAELPAAIEKAFFYDKTVMVEAFMAGREFTCGVVRNGDALVPMPVTEIISENDFFDYDAKYSGKSQEVTPAEISLDLTKKCQQLSLKLYQILQCKGMVRFDYILVNNDFHLIEANTIPGMSEASIFPQMAAEYGWSIEELLNCVVNEALSHK